LSWFNFFFTSSLRSNTNFCASLRSLIILTIFFAIHYLIALPQCKC
jgi:hypothetical protein